MIDESVIDQAIDRQTEAHLCATHVASQLIGELIVCWVHTQPTLHHPYTRVRVTRPYQDHARSPALHTATPGPPAHVPSSRKT